MRTTEENARQTGRGEGGREGRGRGCASERASGGSAPRRGWNREGERACKQKQCSLSLSPPSLPSQKQAGSAHNHHPSVPLRRVRRTPEKDKRKNDLFWKTLIKQLSTWYLSHLLLRDHQYLFRPSNSCKDSLSLRYNEYSEFYLYR